MPGETEPIDVRVGVTDIDKTIHEPVRLMIMANLFVLESADFLFLMNRMGLTFGNLSSHMKKLEDAGYIEVVKEFVGRKPHTMLRLTNEGRHAFMEYRRRMGEFLGDLPD
ncbi:MAG: transcriptional regulator [Methanomassiliicoccales archaeon]|nr:transcriptional regulator [Methanomassiliicoccales archaeon]NYT15393.1 transcriptional regulator [Methanomassiliicoccales archaeon]